MQAELSPSSRNDGPPHPRRIEGVHFRVDSEVVVWPSISAHTGAACTQATARRPIGAYGPSPVRRPRPGALSLHLCAGTHAGPSPMLRMGVRLTSQWQMQAEQPLSREVGTKVPSG